MNHKSLCQSEVCKSVMSSATVWKCWLNSLSVYKSQYIRLHAKHSAGIRCCRHKSEPPKCLKPMNTRCFNSDRYHWGNMAPYQIAGTHNVLTGDCEGHWHCMSCGERLCCDADAFQMFPNMRREADTWLRSIHEYDWENWGSALRTQSPAKEPQRSTFTLFKQIFSA